MSTAASVAADLGVLRTQLTEFEATISENASGTQTKMDMLEAKLISTIKWLRELHYTADAAVRALDEQMNALELEGQQGSGQRNPENKSIGQRLRI